MVCKVQQSSGCDGGHFDGLLVWAAMVSVIEDEDLWSTNVKWCNMLIYVISSYLASFALN